MSSPRLPNDRFTVGWVCAIKHERVAAECFLDEKYDYSPTVSINDNNSYTLGRIGDHHVVVASLPDGQYGLVSAATVASDMMHTFHNIRVGLMVGLAGGAPRKIKNSPLGDIRLGDVVVSEPKDGNGGVFQYDFGIAEQEQQFRETGHLDSPPVFLRAAVATLRAEHEMRKNGIDEAISSVLAKNELLAHRGYKRPSADKDRLFKPDFLHKEEGDECCDKPIENITSHLVPRAGISEHDDSPAIHYGIIASGNKLMKDATIRDKLAEDRNILCFEMEAAGLMNHFPCIVIRGICDYSDTHKTYNWHGYASLAAAAYARDLLNRIPLNSIEQAARAQDNQPAVTSTKAR